MDREAAKKALIKLAQQSAGTLQHLRGDAFLGDTTVETGNTIYRFKDGAFAGCAPKPAAGEHPAWESPPSMGGLELIGFFTNENGLWSLSPRWRVGSLAVMWRLGAARGIAADKAFTLTSPTRSCGVERLVPREVAPAGAMVFSLSRPAAMRRPVPRSMAGVQPVRPFARG